MTKKAFAAKRKALIKKREKDLLDMTNEIAAKLSAAKKQK